MLRKVSRSADIQVNIRSSADPPPGNPGWACNTKHQGEDWDSAAPGAARHAWSTATGHRRREPDEEPQMLLTSTKPDLETQFVDVRGFTERLAAPLSAEDQTSQSMPDASPTKWHRGHTTWFFEEFILAKLADYTVFDPTYRFLFN